MKRLILLTLAFIALTALSGCFMVWTDDMLLVTVMKDYSTPFGTSKSHSVKAKATISPIPKIELETK